MNRSAFKEAVADQYCDLYWDEELLNEMYRVVDRGKSSNVRSKSVKYEFKLNSCLSNTTKFVW